MKVEEVTSLELVSQEPAPAPNRLDPAHLRKLLLLAEELNASLILLPTGDLPLPEHMLVYVPAKGEEEPATVYHIRQKNTAQE